MTSNRGPLDKQEFIGRLLSPERAETLDPLVIMSFCPINIHDTVADIGCGPGYFALPLAKYVAHGKLYALDTDDEMLEALRERVTAAKLGNIEILKNDGANFPLPEASLDGLLLAFVIHDSEERLAFLEAAAKLLKRSGWCCVLEWYRKETEYGPPLEMRIEPEEMMAIGKDAGLTLLRQRDLKGTQYMLLFKR